MSEIKIKCPSCGKILRIPYRPNIDKAVITCPVCKEKHIVGNCERYNPQPVNRTSAEETQYGDVRNTSSGDETLIGDSDGTRIGTQQPVGVGKLVDGNGEEYLLRQGVNTIGRKASTSNATLQINTADRYMSRSHAIISVNAGIHIIRNHENKNPSYVNGIMIVGNDQVVLNDGDNVKLGNTVLTFRK